MEKKSSSKSVNNVIYILVCVMLAAIIVVGVITAGGTANITEQRLTEKEAEAHEGEKENQREEASESEEADLTERDSEKGEAESEEASVETAMPLEFCLPVTGYISKDFSMDIPVYSLTMNDYRTHSGIDIQAAMGSAVSAVAEGKVTDRYTDPFMGICVEVTHGGGLVSRYMNLGSEYPEDAEVGCSVYCGQTIACVGDTAAVEAADSGHLHFELLKDSKPVDPIDYIGYEPMKDEGFEE